MCRYMMTQDDSDSQVSLPKGCNDSVRSHAMLAHVQVTGMNYMVLPSNYFKYSDCHRQAAIWELHPGHSLPAAAPVAALPYHYGLHNI